MSTYASSLGAALRDWRKAAALVIFTALRLVFGWSWVTAGWEKLSWLGGVATQAGQPAPVSNSAGFISVLADHLAGPKVTHFDPLGINVAFAWVANHLFLALPRATDFLVVGFELGVGLLLILGLGVFWAALAAFFLNSQFFAAGSYNNFGYLWTDLALLRWARYADALGLGGLLRVARGRGLLLK